MPDNSHPTHSYLTHRPCPLLGERLRERRIGNGLETWEVAHRMGWTHARLSGVEQGVQPVTPQDLLMLCRLYGCRPSDVLDGPGLGTPIVSDAADLEL